MASVREKLDLEGKSRIAACGDGSRGNSGAAGGCEAMPAIKTASFNGNGYVQIPPFPPIPLTRHAYVDTFRVWLPHHLNRGARASLREMDPGMHYTEAREKEFWAKQGGAWIRYIVAVTFQSLDRNITEVLEQHCHRPLVNGVHLALDWVFATQKDALRAGDFAKHHIVKRGHRGSHPIDRFKESDYYGRRGSRNTLAIYADKQYRHGAGYACHLEARLQGRAALTERGIRSLRDLLTFDHRAFWQRNLRLVVFDRRRLGKRVTGRHLSSAPRITGHGAFIYDNDLRAGDTYIRAAGSPTAVLATLRQHGMAAAGVYHEFDHTAYLP